MCDLSLRKTNIGQESIQTTKPSISFQTPDNSGVSPDKANSLLKTKDIVALPEVKKGNIPGKSIVIETSNPVKIVNKGLERYQNIGSAIGIAVGVLSVIPILQSPKFLANWGVFGAMTTLTVAMLPVTAGSFIGEKVYNSKHKKEVHENKIKALESRIKAFDPKEESEKQSNLKIKNAESISATNDNTISIYGSQVSKEDACEWLTNNPDLARSPKLLKLADFKTFDGKIDADELSKIASAGAVILNGPNSFYLPGVKNDKQVISQTSSAQEEFYKRKNAEAKAEVISDAIGLFVGGVSEAKNKILR